MPLSQNPGSAQSSDRGEAVDVPDRRLRGLGRLRVRRSGVSARLLATVLVPMAIIGVGGVALIRERVRAAEQAASIVRAIPTLNRMVTFNRLFNQEVVTSEGALNARELGVDDPNVAVHYGFASETVAQARAQVDDQLRLLGGAAPVGFTASLSSLRGAINGGSISATAADSQFTQLATEVSAALGVRLAGIQAQSTTLTGTASLNRALQSLADANAVLGASTGEASDLSNVYFASPATWPGRLIALGQQMSLFGEAGQRLNGDVLPVRQAWRRLANDPATVAVQAAAATAGSAAPSTGTAQTLLLLRNEPTYKALVTELDLVYPVVDQGEAAVRQSASALQASGTRDLREALIAMIVISIVSFASALRLARSITRPLRRLEAHARGITSGTLAAEPLPAEGPREVVVVSEAFNEMVSHLGRLEAEAEAFQSRLLHDATHDQLTGLHNRAAALQALTEAMARGAEPGRTAVLFVDLDGFKDINDRYGHAAGDATLKEIAWRLRSATRDDFVARLGGDEFIILMEGIDTDKQASVIARRVIEAARQPVNIGPAEVLVGASVGIAHDLGPDDTPARLLARADTAVYQAKNRGRGRAEIHQHPSDLPQANNAA